LGLKEPLTGIEGPQTRLNIFNNGDLEGVRDVIIQPKMVSGEGVVLGNMVLGVYHTT